MTILLITGMSGTGKSTVLSILRQRGYAIAETDERGWCIPEDGDWSTPDNEWIWDEDRITALLDKHASTHLLIDGCRPNQGRFYGRFDHIIVFKAPIEVMLDRVTNRTTNPFGASANERDTIAQDKHEFEPILMRGADLVIDTSTMSPEEIADQLESLL